MNKRILLGFAIIAFLVAACASRQQEEKIIIALSKGAGSEHYLQYKKWIESINDNVQGVDLYYLSDREEVDAVMSKTSGLVLTGGPDVHPGRYGREFDTSRCEIDARRDTLEFYLIELAKRKHLPVLGICRGLQILNVANGGTLFVDIPEDYGTKVIHRSDTGVCYHYVTIDTLSLLYNIVKVKRIKVNSSHHQGIKVPAEKFVVNARSDDNFIEGIELKNKSGQPFFLAVQWHPERLNDEISERILRRFIESCLIFQKSKELTVK